MGFDAEEVFVLHPERVGQTQLIVTERLPRNMGPDGAQEALEACGVVLGDCEDELFFSAKLPTGWQLMPSFEPRLSALVDEHNRERARIFYKASAHDSKAFLHLTCRYNIRDWTHDEIIHKTEPMDFVREVTDGGSALMSTGTVIQSFTMLVDDAEPKLRFRKHRQLVKQAEAWLDEHYPEHLDPFAYWD